MSFPYYNVQEAVFNVDEDPGGDEAYNWFTPSQGVDVSGIEAEASVVGGLSADSANYIEFDIEDGGADGTGTTSLVGTKPGGTPGWTDVTPQSFTMSTSASDLDADDWVNFSYEESGTVAPTGFTAHAKFPYGLPGGVA